MTETRLNFKLEHKNHCFTTVVNLCWSVNCSIIFALVFLHQMTIITISRLPKITTRLPAYSDIVWSHLATVTFFWFPYFTMVTLIKYKPFTYSDTFWPLLRVSTSVLEIVTASRVQLRNQSKINVSSTSIGHQIFINICLRNCDSWQNLS